MLEEEFYEVRDLLLEFEYRIPHKGVQFRYGIYTLECFEDALLKQDYYTIRNKSLFIDYFSIYPLVGTNVGFEIRAIHTSKNEIVSFLNEVGKHRNIQRKISVHEGYLKNLIFESKSTCSICLETYNNIEDIFIYDCAHHLHTQCKISNGEDILKKCPLCRI